MEGNHIYVVHVGELSVVSSVFEKHERNRSTAKSYQCKEYGKILSSTSLQIHERTHTEEKLYQSL